MKKHEELKVGSKWICKYPDFRMNQIATIVCVNVYDITYVFEDGWQVIVRLEFFFENFEKIENGNKFSQNEKDTINPAHYQQGKAQVWDFIIDQKLGYLEGCIIKYITRYKLKNGVEDLEKAKKYLEKLIEVESKK